MNSWEKLKNKVEQGLEKAENLLQKGVAVSDFDNAFSGDLTSVIKDSDFEDIKPSNVPSGLTRAQTEKPGSNLKEQKLDIRTADREQLVQCIKSQKDKIKNLETTLNDTLKGTDIHKKEEIVELNKKLSDKDNHVKSLESRVAELEREKKSLESVKTAIQSKLQGFQQLSTDLSTSKSQLEVKTKELIEFNNEINLLKSVIRELEEKNNNYQSTVNSLQQQLEKTREETTHQIKSKSDSDINTNTKEKNTIERQEIIDIKEELAKAQVLTFDLDQQLQTKDTQLKQLESENTTYKRKFGEQLEQIDEYRKDIQEKDKEIEKLKSTISELNSKIGDIDMSKQNEIDSLRAQLNIQIEKVKNNEKTYEKEKQFLSLEIEVLKKTSASPDNSAIKELNELKDSLKKEHQSNLALMDQLEISENNNKSFLEKMKEIQLKFEDIENEKKDLTNKVSEKFTADITKLQKENQQLKITTIP